MFKKLGLILMVLCMGAFAYADNTLQMLEEEGLLDGPANPISQAGYNPRHDAPAEFLMIPDSTSDTVGMYDPYDGTYLGQLIDGTGLFSTPINAILGPDGNIYVSDQVADSVFVYDIDGNYLSTYADGTDGLNNIRGMAFRDNNLFVTSGDDYVAEFDGPHSRLPDFISGVDCFDIEFLADGSCLVVDIGLDKISYFDATGAFQYDVIAADFGEQCVADLEIPGEFLSAQFSEKNVKDFELDGTLVETTLLSTYGRGIFRLGNGNLLSSQGDGVWEVEPGTGTYIEQKFAGSMRYVEYVGEMTPKSLTITPKEISAWLGGVFTFTLNGGVDLAGRNYLLLGSTSGTAPGTVLPGGIVIELNYDWFTDLLLSMALAGGYGVVNDFIGTLDVDGKATATLNLPGGCELYEDVDVYFAWCTYKPFDFVSNSVQGKVLGQPSTPDSYLYDDGTSENALGWTAGGAVCWTHGFDSSVGDDIQEISSTFGQAGSTTGPANGTACELYVWSDPNQDGDPADAGLLGTANGAVANTNTNTFNHYAFGAPVAVVGKFFVGCKIEQLSGVYAAPMDQSSTYAGHSFFMGAYTGSGLTWDPTNVAGSAIYEMGAIGYPANWLLRANDF